MTIISQSICKYIIYTLNSSPLAVLGTGPPRLRSHDRKCPRTTFSQPSLFRGRDDGGTFRGLRASVRTMEGLERGARTQRHRSRSAYGGPGTHGLPLRLVRTQSSRSTMLRDFPELFDALPFSGSRPIRSWRSGPGKSLYGQSSPPQSARRQARASTMPHSTRWRAMPWLRRCDRATSRAGSARAGVWFRQPPRRLHGCSGWAWRAFA